MCAETSGAPCLPIGQVVHTFSPHGHIHNSLCNQSTVTGHAIFSVMCLSLQRTQRELAYVQLIVICFLLTYLLAYYTWTLKH